jgi:hypothetical protein
MSGVRASMPAWTSVPSPPAELTVGKHAAPPGSSAHPLVAEALAHRASDAPRHEATPGSPGGLGWPGPPPGEPGVGWPVKDAADVDGSADEEPAPAGSARGWRRLFRSRAAA